MNILNNMIDGLEKAHEHLLKGLDVFKLNDTFGFPLDLTKEIAAEQGIEIDDEKKRKGLFQVSYNVRMLVQAAWVVIAIAAPCFQPVAGIAPLLFPRVTIYYLQITGRYKPETPKEPEVSVEEDAGSAPAPASEDEGGEN